MALRRADNVTERCQALHVTQRCQCRCQLARDDDPQRRRRRFALEVGDQRTRGTRPGRHGVTASELLISEQQVPIVGRRQRFEPVDQFVEYAHVIGGDGATRAREQPTPTSDGIGTEPRGPHSVSDSPVQITAHVCIRRLPFQMPRELLVPAGEGSGPVHQRSMAGHHVRDSGVHRSDRGPVHRREHGVTNADVRGPNGEQAPRTVEPDQLQAQRRRHIDRAAELRGDGVEFGDRRGGVQHCHQLNRAPARGGDLREHRADRVPQVRNVTNQLVRTGRIGTQRLDGRQDVEWTPSGVLRQHRRRSQRIVDVERGLHQLPHFHRLQPTHVHDDATGGVVRDAPRTV